MSQTSGSQTSSGTFQLAAELADSYGISSLRPLLESCRAFAGESPLNIAVFGRFNAGKSSFLNHLFGRGLLPVGVVPVTSVVTEIRWGPRERATVRFVDGRGTEVQLGALAEYIDESRNPGNRKQAALVSIELPEMERFRGVSFVDTPGLESVLSHSTETSLRWLPNVGLALVAVGADPPLSQRDIELIRQLNRYTPNISLLLTKVDLLDEPERRQVLEYVRAQLGRYWNGSVAVYPYSIRPGYERLRREFEDGLLNHVMARSAEQRRAILARKLETLLAECGEYLGVALKSAEAADSERASLRKNILGDRQSLEDLKLGLRLIARHAAANTRSQYEQMLARHEREIRGRLLEEFEENYPAWTESLATAAASFEAWLQPAITGEMTRLSAGRRVDFSEPLRRVCRQLSQSLQDFRNRISGRMLDVLGVPLHTMEVEIAPDEPAVPDIRIGRIFDREWEMISFLIPMWVAGGIVGNHFRRMIADVVFKNLSRLASQWEKSVNTALFAVEKEAQRRLDDLIATIERIVAAAGREAPRIRQDLARVETARRDLRAASLSS